MRTISIGAQWFEKLRANGCFYVDKTDFIREWWEGMVDVTLITRPRRFGKTLNLDTLNCFFSNQYADREDLFEGLSIWRHEEYRKLQGAFPVIFLSFADVKEKRAEMAKQRIMSIIGNLYGRYHFLLDSEALGEAQKEEYKNRCYKINASTMADSLKFLAELLFVHFGKRVIILLDEYDTPLHEAYVGDYWEEMVEFIRSLFNSTFKTNPYLERALMTGVTRVSKGSIFSDLNNLEVVTTTSNKYMTAFGFTEREVFGALDEFGLSDQKEHVKRWYDGFTFGTANDIYNPWSITSYLEERKFAPYWANTSSNSLVGTWIRRGSDGIKQSMESLLKGGSIETLIDEEIVYSQLDETDEAIWSLLLASGYLRIDRVDTRNMGRASDGEENVGWARDAYGKDEQVEDEEYDEAHESEEFRVAYRLKLTNFEVKSMFRKMIAGWYRRRNVPYNQFVRAMLDGNLREMNLYLNEVLLETISSFDGAGKPSDKVQPERFYHGLVLGLIATEGKYQVRSNGESGYGRYDVMMVPKRCIRERGEKLPSFVIEFKVFNEKAPDYEKSLKDTVRRALDQIRGKQYDTALLTQGIPKEAIRHLGFGFQGKNVLIGTECREDEIEYGE